MTARKRAISARLKFLRTMLVRCVLRYASQRKVLLSTRRELGVRLHSVIGHSAIRAIGPQIQNPRRSKAVADHRSLDELQTLRWHGCRMRPKVLLASVALSTVEQVIDFLPAFLLLIVKLTSFLPPPPKISAFAYFEYEQGRRAKSPSRARRQFKQSIPGISPVGSFDHPAR